MVTLERFLSRLTGFALCRTWARLHASVARPDTAAQKPAYCRRLTLWRAATMLPEIGGVGIWPVPGFEFFGYRQ